jgi:hypothetical protein
MTYVASDFGLDKNGPQFAWLDERLTLHGFPPIRLLDPPKDRVQRFQLAQGWKGTGADGLVGPMTLLRLTANPSPPVGHNVDLSVWKLTLPVGDDGPDEHFPIDGEYPPWFVDSGDRLVFRADVDGVTTTNSGYPRSELREMNKDGSRAAWSSERGLHTLTGACEIRKVPGLKPSVVIAQIHDAADDVVMLRLDGDVLYLYESLGKDQGSVKHPLLSAYRLGATLTYSIAASPTGITAVVNGKRVDLKRLCEGAYFKAGCYCQANETNGTGYAEVAHKDIKVRHI